MAAKKKILIIDDAPYLGVLSTLFADDAEVDHVLSIPEAETILPSIGKYDAVFLDACIPGSSVNTLPLLEKIRSVYPGRVIACSGMSAYNQTLVAAGATSAVLKECIIGKIREIVAG